MPSRSKEAALATSLAAGIQKHFSGVSTLTFGSGSFAPAQLVADFKQLATMRQDVIDAQTAAKAKLAVEKAQAPAIHSILVAFVELVRAMFAGQPAVLADFGLKPKKAPAKPTVEQKAAAKAKRDATRGARGTRGKRQKKGIHGDVTGVVVTPVVSSPQPPVVQPQPASSASKAPSDGTPAK